MRLCEKTPCPSSTTCSRSGSASVADHLQSTGQAAVREALRGGRTVHRGQGYSVRVAAPLALHQAALQQCAALVWESGTPAGRKAYRAYADRIAAVAVVI
jgi:putative DNA-invertase from lambdoid prophage Rac